MVQFRIPALVLGGFVGTDLGAVRALGRAGVTVYYLSDHKNEVTYSKYCRKHFIFPNIGFSEGELARALVKLKKAVGDAVLFPTSDLHALYLSDLADDLHGYYLTVPNREVLEIMINKRKFYEYLMKHDIPHPTTRFPENLQDLKETGEEIQYPVFLKPYFSHQFTRHFRSKGFIAHSERDLQKYFVSLKQMGIDVMVQEIVPGPPTNHIFLDGYADRNSNPKALFVRQRLRMWPLAFGNSSLCVSIPSSKVTPLKKILFKYLKSINYHGIFSAEFKKDQRTGILKLLEINSRTSAWFNAFSERCGINIMFIAYADTVGMDVKYSEDYTTGIKWVYFKDDLKAAAKMMHNGDLKFSEYISSLLGVKEYMSYAKDDIKPFLINLKNVIARFRARTLILKRMRNHAGCLATVIPKIFSLTLRFPISRIIYLSALNWQLCPKQLKNYLGWGIRRAVTVHPSLSKTFMTGKALIIYYSRTGNTEKVALAIERGLRKGGLEPTVKKVSEAFDENYYDYDLVCFGTPVMHALPPPPVMKLIRYKFAQYRKPPSEVRLPARPIPGKNALVFITFSGPHVGIDEALPAGKFLVQEFKHLGFQVKGEWYIVGEFHGWKEGSIRGFLGDIRGRPNAEDLARIEEKTLRLVRSLRREIHGGGENAR